MIKVAMIGAGSVVFSKNLTGDILSYPELRNATLSYMDIDPQRLDVGACLCRKVAAAVGADPTIDATADRKAALRGADFVINMVQVGGQDSTLIDFEIPRKYGLRFTIADTTGPGGIFRALRTYPMLRALCREMQELCPRAVLLNYSNPMSMNMQTITRTSDVRAIGLCHSVQGTLCELMSYIGENPENVAFECAGINHMAFYTRLEKNGVDLYPRLFEAMRQPHVYNSNRVRFELMRRLGYFVTESSEHNAEYSPYFIPHGNAMAHRFGVPIDEYLRRCDVIVDEFERLCRFAKSDEPITIGRSPEYGSTIIHSMATGRPSVVYGNMPNRGAIANLPPTAIAEAATLVDRAGLRMTAVGELPPQLIAYMNPHVAQHELFIRAAMGGWRDHIYQAAMFDPLTAATLTLDQIVELCDELIAAHGLARDGGSLPDLDAKKTMVGSSGKTFGRVDPADLRERRTAACRARHIIADWHVIGPFPAEHEGRNGLALRTGVEELALKNGGRIDVNASIPCREDRLRWRPARANAKGFVDLAAAIGNSDWAVAYGFAIVDSPTDSDVLLHVGSDDGIAIWLNGALIHENEVGRGFCLGIDQVPARLKAGANHLLVKIDNYVGGWGFGAVVERREK